MTHIFNRIFLSFVFFAHAAPALGENEKIKIGVITALSGRMATIGTAVKNGIELARSEHPRHFEQISFVYEDDQFDAKQSVSAYQKLKNSDKVSLIFGFGDTLAHVLGPMADRDRIPLINFNFETSAALGRTHLVRAMNHTQQYMDALAKFLLEQNHRNFSIISVESPFFNAMKGSFVSALGNRGTASLIESYSPADTDFKSSILKLKAQPDVPVGLFISPDQLIAFIKQSNELNFKPVFFGTDLFETAASIASDPGLFEGCLYPDNNVDEAFRTRYFKAFGDAAQLTFAGSGYDMSMLAAETLSSDKPFDSGGFMQSLGAVRQRRGVLGEYSFVEDNPHGKYFEYPVRVKRIKNKVGVPAETETAQDTIKIGSILILTGEGAAWGRSAQNGMDLAIEKVNAGGGVLGKKLAAVHQDDHGDPKATIAAFRELTEVEDIHLIIGPSWSNLAMPLIGMANSSKTVMISPSIGVAKFTESSKFLFSTWPYDVQLSAELADYVFQQGHRNAALVGAEHVWVKEQTNSFKTKFEQLGGKISVLLEPAPGTTDLRAEALKIKNTPMLDAYVSTTDGVLIGSLAAKALRDLNFRLPMYSIALDQSAIDAAQGGFEGLVFLTCLTPTDDFKAEYEKRYDTSVDAGADTAYDAVMMLAQAIRESNSTDAESVAEKLSQIKEFNGASGQLTANGKRGFSKRFAMKRVFQGRPQDLAAPR